MMDRVCTTAVSAVIAGLAFAFTPASAAPKTSARAVLFIIDGLHWKAPHRLALPHIQRLAAEGVSIERAYCIFPAHPTTGEYGKLHTTSIPNPTLLAGSLFLKPGHKMVQESFSPDEPTAHGTNLTAYASLDRGFTHTLMQNGLTDADVVTWATDLLPKTDVRFMRLHLQDVGASGMRCADTNQNVPWRRNIWAAGSPYVAAARRADRLLGKFVADLKTMNKWSDTLLVVMADHGQADSGWHPPSQQDSWITPLIFVGPGVAGGKTILSADHIDVVPTLCNLMGVAPPSTGAGTGRILHEIKDGSPCQRAPRPSRVKQLNGLIRDYLILEAELRLLVPGHPNLERVLIKAQRQFYGINRFLDWHQARSIDDLLETNHAVIEKMKQALAESRAK